MPPAAPPKLFTYLSLMQNEQLLDQEATSFAELFPRKWILVCTFFGGPVAAVWLMYLNWVRMEKLETAKSFLQKGALVTLVYFVAVSLIPEEVPIPGIVYTLIILAIVNSIIVRTQGDLLTNHFDRNGAKASVAFAIGITFVSALFTLLVIGGLLMLFDPEFSDFVKEILSQPL